MNKFRYNNSNNNNNNNKDLKTLLQNNDGDDDDETLLSEINAWKTTAKPWTINVAQLWTKQGRYQSKKINREKKGLPGIVKKTTAKTGQTT